MPERRTTRTDLRHRILSVGERRFIEEYCLDLNADAASVRAGIGSREGRRLLGQSKVQNALAIERNRRANRTQLYGDEVVRRYWQVATADARELSHIRYVNCRHCWGLDHRHQYRDHELAIEARNHLALQRTLPEKERVPFDDAGGGGFLGMRDPMRGPAWAEREIAAGGDAEAILSLVNSDHDCPACDGIGEQFLWVADQRTLSPGAAALFDGLEISKDGRISVKLRNRDHALAQLGKHLGLFVNRTAVVNLDVNNLTDEQIDQFLRQLGGGDRPPTVIDHAPTVDDP